MIGMWVESLEVRDLRNVRQAQLSPAPGLNVLVGRNAQGKTTLLESVGLLARGRSFRTDDTPSVVRRGARSAHLRGRVASAGALLEVEVEAARRRLRVDGREVAPQAYQGRLEAVVYSTDRLRVVRGGMRERRAFLDRQGAMLWPAYRQAVREHDAVLRQRNAALLAGSRDLAAWDETMVAAGARLRERRARLASRLQERLRAGFRPAGEEYTIEACPGAAGEDDQRALLAGEIERARGAERRARRSLVGPHRDPVRLLVDGQEAQAASSGQARSLLLALTLCALELFREERGEAAVALLDDLDSELDDGRASELCAEVARRGQAFVTTAHAPWAARMAGLGRIFAVEAGAVRAG